MEEFTDKSSKYLSSYLAVRGISASGKKKPELIARCNSTVVLGIDKIATQEEALKDLESEYVSRLTLHGLTVDPRNINQSEKTDDVSVWPKVDLGKIFEYILQHREYNKDYIGKYKDNKAFTYWEDGHV